MADIVFPGKAVSGVLGRDFLPANFDLEIYKGDYLPMKVTLRNPPVAPETIGTPINLTGYTATAQIRANYGDPVIYNLDVEIPDPATGVVHITLASNVSAGIQPGSYVWDFQTREPNGNTRTHIAGDVTVFNEVTVG